MHGDIGTPVATSHLFKPLPETIRDDDAFHDRWHAYLPGSEMAELTPILFTSQLGFIADFNAENFHNEPRPESTTPGLEVVDSGRAFQRPRVGGFFVA